MLEGDKQIHWRPSSRLRVLTPHQTHPSPPGAALPIHPLADGTTELRDKTRRVCSKWKETNNSQCHSTCSKNHSLKIPSVMKSQNHRTHVTDPRSPRTPTRFRGLWLTALVFHKERRIKLKNTSVRPHRRNPSRTAPLFASRDGDELLRATAAHPRAAATPPSCAFVNVKHGPGNFISGTKIAIVRKALRDLGRALRVPEQRLCQANFLRQRVKKVRSIPTTFSISFFTLSPPE